MRPNGIPVPVRRLVLLLSAALAILLAAPSAALAGAGPDTGTARGAGDIGVTGIGTGTHLTIQYATIFQCPGEWCNKGQINSVNEDIADICYLPIDTPWGDYWHLVLNHANNHVGFITGRFLYQRITDPTCTNVPRRANVTIANASLFQCPAQNCNQGVAQPSEPIADLCYLPYPTPWGDYWHLVLDLNPAKYHVGFMSGRFITGPLTQTRC